MSEKNNQIKWALIIGATLIIGTLFTVVNEFITDHWGTVLKKLADIETVTNETYVETVKTNHKIQDVEVIKEEKIVEPIIQPVIIQEVIVEKKREPIVIEWPIDTFVDRTAINRCIDLFKRACILDGNETPEDCVIDAQYECEEDPNIRF